MHMIYVCLFVIFVLISSHKPTVTKHYDNINNNEYVAHAFMALNVMHVSKS